MPAPFLAAIPALMNPTTGALLSGLAALGTSPIVSRLLSEIARRPPTPATAGESSRRSNFGSNGRRGRGRARVAQSQAQSEAPAQTALAEEMEAPESVTPTPREQTASQPRTAKKSSGRRQPEAVAVVEPVAEVSVAVEPPINPNAMPIERAVLNPDTSYEEAAALASAVEAEQAAAEQAALDSRYNQLLAMYGLTPGGGAPRVNPEAAQEYYQDPSIYEALSRVYAGAPAWR